MNFKRLSLLLVLAGLISLNACKKEDPAPDTTVPPTSGNGNGNGNGNNNGPAPTGNAIKISFENFAGNSPLTLGTTNLYQNTYGDSFSVSIYKYYISNVKLTDANGNVWSEPESYHLINQADTNSLYCYLRDVPAASYVSMSFLIGVDSTRNCSGTQTGALDPANGMFWTWSSGYIMAKLEGKSPSSPAGNNRLTFHCGGYYGQYSSIRSVAPSFNSLQALVTTNTVPVMHLKSDVLKWFESPNVIDFSQTYNTTTTGPASVMIADNYASMFTITGIDN